MLSNNVSKTPIPHEFITNGGELDLDLFTGSNDQQILIENQIPSITSIEAANPVVQIIASKNPIRAFNSPRN